MNEQERKELEDELWELWKTHTIGINILRDFFIPKIEQVARNAVKKYDAMLFNEGSCYRTVGVWASKREKALKQFNIEDPK